MVAIRRGFDPRIAARHLGRVDPAFKSWIQRLGPIEAPISWGQSFDPSDALARSILFQQLSGKAAGTIVGRLEAALGTKRINHESLAQISDERMRECGVSGNKARALRDLAARDSRGEIPSLRKLVHMPEQAIIEALTEVRGIGRWTVEMMLMFRLGRSDVLPIDDLGVRKGAQKLDGAEMMPTPKELARRGEIWGPYRTYAAMYLWRICDDVNGAQDVTRSSDP